MIISKFNPTPTQAQNFCAVRPSNFDAFDSMRAYKNDIAKLCQKSGLLSREAEINLVKKSKTGDEKARNELVEANLRLVLDTVGHFSQDSRLMFADMVQVGNEALMEAVNRFEVEAGTRFSTYAVTCIRNAIFDELNVKGRCIELKRGTAETIGKFRKTTNELTHKLFRQPTIEEIAEKMDIGVDTAQRYHEVNMCNNAEPLHKPVGKNRVKRLADTIKEFCNPFSYV